MLKGKLTNILVLFSCLVSFGIGELLARYLLEQPQFVYIRQDPDFEQRLTGGKADNLAYSKTGHPGEGGLFIQTKTGLRLRALCTRQQQSTVASEIPPLQMHIEYSLLQGIES